MVNALAGFSVIDSPAGGRVAIKPVGQSQGLAVQAGEVLLIGQVEPDPRRRITIANLAAATAAGADPRLGLSAVAITRFFRAAVADAATSPNPSLRLWSALIRDGVPSNTWRQSDPGSLPLDPLQANPHPER
ncbi:MULTISPECIES: hypothetical protein [unclassified Actinoplanes]|uniref:hypothetical protein n=1 Tax=unclassified Actinoplanes TaxID=2626549 RepID=UPI0012BACAE8|nr:MULTISPECIES: hypothetical protein [unclassified Actinoplanes]